MIRPMSARASEIVIVALIFGFGTILGVHAVRAFRAAGGAQDYYQSEFGPAVMAACGRGFRSPDTRLVPALAAFLSQRSNTVACADVPLSMPTQPPDAFQSTSQYLELAVALTWKATGVSWSRLAILPGLMFGAVAAATYLLLRLALSRVLAFLALVPSLMTTANFTIVPQLRDYAKGPFLLAVILIMGCLVIGDANRRRAIGLSATAGALIGVGLGFRTDLLIALAPFMIALAFLVPATLPIRTRLIAIAVFLISFALLGYPVLKSYSRGGNTGHVVLLGLAGAFDRPLGVQPSVYEFVGQYNDSLAYSIINGFAIRTGRAPQGVGLSTIEYDRAATAYLGRLGATFPADLVTRTLAATREVPAYFLHSSLDAPSWAHSALVGSLYRVRAGVASRLSAIGFAVVVGIGLAISVVRPRAAWLLVVVLIGFAGSSAVQFHERHFYYLQFVPWLAFGLIAQTLIGGRTVLRERTVADVKHAAVFAALVVTGAAAAIVSTRAYQQAQITRLFGSYEAAARRALPVVQQGAASGRVLLTSPEWLAPLTGDSPRVRTRFLAIEFRDDLCAPRDVSLILRYDAVLPELDFSEPVTVPMPRNSAVPTTLFFAAFDRPDDTSRFRGVELSAEQSRCVEGVFRLDQIEGTALLLTTVLSGDWRREPLHQRFR